MTSTNPDHNHDHSAMQWTTVSNLEPAIALPQGTMLTKLEQVETELLSLLKYPEHWKSLDVTYHLPRVERVYIDYEGLRISLHCIHPCSREEALLHPHPWPSAMRIVSGKYEMAIGYGSGKEKPPLAATIIAAEGTSYEMVEPDAWHYVRPIDEPVLTLMVTEKPWNRTSPKSTQRLNPLSDQRKLEIVQGFFEYYAAVDRNCKRS